MKNMPTFTNEDFHRSIYNDLLANKIISTGNKSSPATPKTRPSVISSKKPITVKPLNSGHSRDRPNCPLLRGVRYWEKLIK